MKKFIKKIPAFMLSAIMVAGAGISVNAAETNSSEVNTRVDDNRPGSGRYNRVTGKFIAYDKDGNEIVAYVSESEFHEYRNSLFSDFPVSTRDTESKALIAEPSTIAVEKQNTNVEDRVVYEDRVNRDCFILNTKTGELSEYDVFGNKTVTILEASELEALQEKMEYSQLHIVDVPKVANPEDGVAVGIPLVVAPYTYINLQAFDIPGDISTIDVFFTNDIGDDTKSIYDVGAYDLVWMEAKYSQENYTAKISSYWGSGSIAVKSIIN